ncbi:MAG: NAD(P)H-dependent oxidoreductase subunit E [Nitrospirota bacterium]|nr:NAD(P)H-dependent oxidoreductase subunit E [Nitrospirota bacterium]
MINKFEIILSDHLKNGGNIISLLQDTQEAFGYIPREAIDFFSREMDIAPSRFYGVATFYSQFRLKPVGQNKIVACCGTACHVKGAEKIINGLTRELALPEGEDTTQDGKFTLEKVACLGTCSFAPVVLINGTAYGKTGTDALLKAIRKLGKSK